MQTVIDVQDLCKQYTTYRREASLSATVKSLFHREKVLVDAVKHLSFQVGEGEIVGLLGENGAGKSTTIKMLTGVLFPTNGSVRVLGYDPSAQRKKYVAHIGAVFGQKSQLIWDIPPMDSFALNQAVYRIPQSDYDQRLSEMLDILGIGDIVQRPTRVLSLGERMKCEFVMAMLHRPRVVFLDEPTIGVDILAKDAIHGFIRRMNSEGTTFILTTHDMEDIESLARRVIIMNHGEKVFEDAIGALRVYLGDRKTITVQMKSALSPAAFDACEGVSVLSVGSDRELTLLVDHALLPMSGFMSMLAGLGEIQDISIKEIGIGAAIKSIYESTG